MTLARQSEVACSSRSVEVRDEVGAIVPVAGDFLAHLAARSCSPNTVLAYGHDLGHLWRFFGAAQLGWERLTPERAVDLLAHLRATPARRRGQPHVPVLASSEGVSARLPGLSRSCHEGERHLEVRVGNVERPDEGRQVFGAVAKSGTDIAALIRRTLDTVGRTSDTELTAFTDGCAGLRSILADAGVTSPPLLDWFHLSMRLQHAKQATAGLPADAPDQLQAKAAIVAEVERLR